MLLTKRTIEVSAAKYQRRTPLTMLKKKKKDTGGRVHRPSEKVRQAVHEREEMVHRHDAKAQRDREHRRRHLLLEEGSENEDEEYSDKERDIKEDEVSEEEDCGTQVGHADAYRPSL